jgi:hypothetical protein
MRALALVVALLSSLAFGQVSGVCSTGKACSLRSVSVQPNTSTAGVCLRNATGNDWLISSSAGGWFWFACTAGTNCQAGCSTYFQSSPTQFLAAPQIQSNSTVTGGIGLQSGLSGTGTAFGSFPTCAAGTAGRLLYDSTNFRWRICESNSPSWQAPLYYSENTVIIPWPSTLTTTNTSFARWASGYAVGGGGGFAGSTSGTGDLKVDISAVVLTAGVGAGTYTLSVQDESLGSVTTAIFTANCTAAAGTFATGGSVTFNNITGAKLMGLRLTANACATLPALNVTVLNTMKDGD